jgi:hypothetical protein
LSASSDLTERLAEQQRAVALMRSGAVRQADGDQSSSGAKVLVGTVDTGESG